VLFSVSGRAAGAVRADLAAQGIHVSIAPLPPPDASIALDPDAGQDVLAVRASVHYLTTEDEIHRLALALHRTGQAGSARTIA
jgi:selenocysteine lyase/cysteine desulfurase